MGNKNLQFDELRIILEDRKWIVDEDEDSFMARPPENKYCDDTSGFQLVVSNDNLLRVYSKNWEYSYSPAFQHKDGISNELVKAIIWYFELRRDVRYYDIIGSFRKNDNITRIDFNLRQLLKRFGPDRDKYIDDTHTWHELAKGYYEKIEL